MPLANYPDVCTEEVKPGQAFCQEHCQLMSKHNVPTGLRDFRKAANLATTDDDDDEDLLGWYTVYTVPSKMTKIDYFHRPIAFHHLVKLKHDVS